MRSALVATCCALAGGPLEDTPVALLTTGGIEILEQGQRRLVAGSAGAETFAWDRDGAHLLITRAGRLERLGLAGGEPARLADGWRAFRMPDVSPDGRRIVVSATRDEDPSAGWQVLLLEREGGEPRVLCDGYDPCFARDGASVLCERYPGRDLWRIELATGAIGRVFETPGDRYTVQADPIARRLAFSSSGRLVVHDLDTGAERCSSPEGAYDRFASFAPDGRRLLFFREHEPAQGPAFRGIRERDLVSGEERTLAEGPVALAAYAPPTLARFEALARAARAGRSAAQWLPIDAQRDRGLRAWLERADEAQHLFLPGLTTLAPAEAAALRGFRGRALFLPDLAALEPAAAALLAEFPGSLFLDGIQALDGATARALAAWKGNGEQLFLSLDGLRDPAPEVLAALGACRGWGLSLEGLTALSPAAAEALGPVHVAMLDLDGVTELSRESAQAIARWHAKFVSLCGWGERDPAAVALVEQGCAGLIVE